VLTKSLEQLIAEKAYEIYQRRGGAPGDSQSDWAQAEKEVAAELKKKEVAKPKAPEVKPVAVTAPKVEIKPAPKEEPKAAPMVEVKDAPKIEEVKTTATVVKPAIASVKKVAAKKTAKK
jgi:hypothetical protein